MHLKTAAVALMLPLNLPAQQPGTVGSETQISNSSRSRLTVTPSVTNAVARCSL
jgi:hypothetical protein